MQKLNVGMIGVGGFGGYRRDRMRESGLFDLVAVTDRNAEVLHDVAQQEGAQACASFDELLRVPGLEGMVISTGADSHAPLAVAAMQAGLHVFVEKPLCTSVQEVHELQRVQRQTGRIVGVGHSYEPSDPVHRVAHQYLEEERLGAVACYEMNSSHSGGLEIQPGEWRGVAARNPGGMLFQCGVHALHSLNELFGPIEAVQAMMRYDANPNTETADVANVLIRHRSGVLGTLSCYHVTGYNHDFRIFGTKGNLYFDKHLKQGWFQKRHRNAVEDREPLTMPALESGVLHANLASWYRAIRESGEPNPSLEHGIHAVLPVFAAEISANEKREVSLHQHLTDYL
jgi:predicted dehydrogenase